MLCLSNIIIGCSIVCIILVITKLVDPTLDASPLIPLAAHFRLVIYIAFLGVGISFLVADHKKSKKV